jgi:hypothetical protein
MFKFRHNLAKAALVAGSVGVTTCLMWVGLKLDRAAETVAQTVTETTSHESVSAGNLPTKLALPTEAARGNVCHALAQYPKLGSELSFHSNIVSNICQPFIKYSRPELDRCGDQKSDPYLSKFTWPTRSEMARRGKVNVFADAAYASRLPEMMKRAEGLRARATDLCCAPDDFKCRDGMAAVKFEVCKPSTDPHQPDPCVFGGTYRMPGAGYDSIFRAIARQRGEGAASQLRSIASMNLLGRSNGSDEPAGVASGSITLSSYISVDNGSASMDPVILHELGHACSMVKMQTASIDTTNMQRAVRAAQWIDSAKKRCDPNFKIPAASDDFWQSVGESRELSACLTDLAVSNQKKLIDKPCNGLCPGHYLEESVGIAFSLLLGDLDGSASAVFPNTCDHVRDGQHPMVSDVAECLMQNSPRFRSRMAHAYGCSEPGSLAGAPATGVAGLATQAAPSVKAAKVTKSSL